jgi:hypothetical protein
MTRPAPRRHIGIEIEDAEARQIDAAQHVAIVGDEDLSRSFGIHRRSQPT